MKNKCVRCFAGVLAFILSFGAVGCGNKKEQETSLVYLDYGTGLDEDGNYNDELYGMNNNDLETWDPCVIYVSEEEDATYGGYYYLYGGHSAKTNFGSLKSEYYKENKISNLITLAYRSKDLYHWEKCGALEGGYVCAVDEEDWAKDLFYAPEVIRNPADGKYYLYFNASAAQDWGVEGMSDSASGYDRFYLCVAVSDTPVGPFDIIYDTDAKTGKRIPTINFHTGCNTKYNWAAIDVHPFFDDNGDFYLYFNKHQDDNYSHLNGIWGMKMKTMSVPDYTTVSCLALPGKYTASSVPGKIEESTGEKDYFVTETGVNEAPFVVKHKGKYYLTYSSNGYGHTGYSVHQAVSDSPLSGFTKMSVEQGNPVLDGSIFGYMNGTGHHSFVRKGDELWIVYHRHDSIYGINASWGRATCVDRVNFVTNAEGLDVLTANGPSKTLQWLSESVSGYTNLAETADIEISTGTGAEYLNDGLLPYYTVVENRVLEAKEDITIKLSWDEPVDVSSVMVYNAKSVDSAFSKIADIRFKFAEKPEWASKDFDYGVIKDLKLPNQYYNTESKEYIACATAVAEIDSIKVTEIQITIKAADRLRTENKHGEKNTTLNLSEIVVLGGVRNNE